MIDTFDGFIWDSFIHTKLLNKTILEIMMLFTGILFILFGNADENQQHFLNHNNLTLQQNNELATIGSGCFWCSEAVFEGLKGIVSVESGYSGGFVKNPSYREVCNGVTGHAEVVQIRFNPNQITYAEILDIFFHTHDPTTLNQQGADIGTQYRSVIFYHNEDQNITADLKIKELNKKSIFSKPIVTQVSQFTAFYKAEDYHQNYFANNPNASYCSFVIRPKIDKFRKNYSEKLK